jgi:hypothetical protein
LTGDAVSQLFSIDAIASGSNRGRNVIRSDGLLT